MHLFTCSTLRKVRSLVAERTSRTPGDRYYYQYYLMELRRRQQQRRTKLCRDRVRSIGATTASALIDRPTVCTVRTPQPLPSANPINGRRLDGWPPSHHLSAGAIPAHLSGALAASRLRDSRLEEAMLAVVVGLLGKQVKPTEPFSGSGWLNT